MTLSVERRRTIAEYLATDVTDSDPTKLYALDGSDLLGNVPQEWKFLFTERQVRQEKKGLAHFRTPAVSPANLQATPSKVQWDIDLIREQGSGVTKGELLEFLGEAGLGADQYQLTCQFSEELIGMLGGDSPIRYQLFLGFAETKRVDDYIRQVLGQATDVGTPEGAGPEKFIVRSGGGGRTP